MLKITAIPRERGSIISLTSGLMEVRIVGMMIPMQTSIRRLFPALPTVVLNLRVSARR